MTTLLNRKFILGTLGLLLTAATLVACGDTPTATPAPAVSTTAAASSTTAAASGTNSAAGANNGAAPGANPPSGTPGAGPGRGQGGGFGGGFNAVTGTVQSYDATKKSLTVQEDNGSSQTFDATSAIISKNTKVTLADLSKENLASDIVQVTGQKGSDGTYSATAVNLADAALMGNGGFPGAGANGTPGALPGRGNGAGANGTPGAGRRNASGTPGPNGTGANGTAGAGAGGFAGGNRLILRNATLSGNTLTGTDQTGASVTVNLSDSTTITKRASDTATDLTAGAKISVNFRAAQNNGTASAVAITIEQ